MASLGTFGAAQREARKDAEKDTFEFCGEQFTVQSSIPPILMLQLGASASGNIEESEGMAAMWQVMRISLTLPQGQGEDEQKADAEFQRFYKVAVANHVSLEELIRLAMALFEAQTGRPTEQRPASPAGPLPTSTSSSGSASRHPALEGYTPVDQLLLG